jgi:hypothetical protein
MMNERSVFGTFKQAQRGRAYADQPELGFGLG